MAKSFITGPVLTSLSKRLPGFKKISKGKNVRGDTFTVYFQGTNTYAASFQLLSDKKWHCKITRVEKNNNRTVNDIPVASIGGVN